MNIIEIDEVSFDVSVNELELIKRIVSRFLLVRYEDDRKQLMMSLQAVTASQGLNLNKLLNSNIYNLVHDVDGIHKYVSHETGKLDFGKFKPSCERKGEENDK